MTFKIQPWAHQLEAIKRGAFHSNFALFFEMGAGKTGTAINMLRSKFNENGRVLKTLVFCPPIVIKNWREEWFKHSSISPKIVHMLNGPGKKRLDDFNKLCFNSASPGSVVITNYESLSMDKLFEAFVRWGPEAIVFDESHKLKDFKAKRSKLAADLANPFDQRWASDPWNNPARPYVYILSGSPVLNTPLDIFQQFKVLDGGQTFGKNYFSFRARYFRDRNEGMPKDRHFPKWEPRNLAQDGFDAFGEINSLIYRKGMRVEKSDCLDLPPEVAITLKCGMSRDQKRLYEEMRRDFITFFNSKACTAQLAITKALRLMQITAGFVSVSNQNLVEDSSNNQSPISGGQEEDSGWSPSIEFALDETPKLDTLSQLLDECVEQKKKVIVWAVWKENYRQIGKLLEKKGINFVEVHGGISAVQKQKNIEAFQNDQTVRVYLGHPGSGGIGVNLTVSDTSIFYSRTFSLEHYLQARARNHRGGSKEAGHDKITHYDLVCEDTIDELAVQKLANKMNMSDELLKDLVSELKVQK